MTTVKHMWRRRWHKDMSQIARALDLDPETIPEDDGRDAILYAIARVRRDAAREALDGLAAAEHRIARLEAQSDIRGRAVVIYRDRAREAEARIKAVQDLIDQADTAGDWTVTCSRLQWAIDGTIRRALDGDA